MIVSENIIRNDYVDLTESLDFNTFTVANFDAWKNTVKATEQGEAQTLSITNHNNHSNHSNSGSSGYDHSNYYSGYSRSSYHSNDVDPLYGGHYNHTTPGSSPTHSDSRSHDDTHSNTSPHSNTGFDHQNYIPSDPHFFELDNNVRVRDTVTIGLFSYDKNNDGVGTQDAVSQTVKYQLRVRKVRNPDGTASVSAWRTLLNWSTAETYALNTVDPLGVGNVNPKTTEGFYELEAIAKNDSITALSVTKNYVGVTKTITVEIKQNTDPEVVVQNGNEFISFVFGNEGALSPSGVFKPYSDNLYTEGNVSQQEGIFVSIKMKDVDVTNYQKAQVYLKNPSGVVIPGSVVNVIWENGSTVIASGGVDKKGYAFIPKSILSSQGSLENIQVIVETSDYDDAACTILAGANIIQNSVSLVNTTMLLVDVDVNPPNIVLDVNGGNYQKVFTPRVQVSDNDVGVGSIYYQWTKDTNAIVEEEWQLVANNTPVPTPNNATGFYYLNIKAVDKLQNQQFFKSNVFKIDNTLPVKPDIALSSTAWTNDGVMLTLTNASDADSGLNRLEYRLGETGTWTIYSAPIKITQEGVYQVYARSIDNSTNISEENVTADTIKIDKTLPLVDVAYPFLTLSTEEWTDAPVTATISVPAQDVGSPYIPQYNIDDTGWVNYISPVVISKDGLTTIKARLVDEAGNIGNEFVKTIQMDVDPPTAPTFTANTAWNNFASIPVTITDGLDPLSGVKRSEYKLEGATVQDWATYTGTFNIVNEGITTVRARSIDNLNHISDETVFEIKIDRTIPNNPSVIINANDAYTNLSTVNLDLSVEDNLSPIILMQFQNDDGTWSTPETYSLTKIWNLTAGEGVRKVAVRFQDEAGNWSVPVFDTITVDLVIPVVDSFSINGGDLYVNTSFVKLNITSHDNSSGVEKILISNDQVDWTVIDYADMLDWVLSEGDGNKTVYIKLEDRAGNVSPVSQDSIFLDTVKPTGEITINSGNEYTQSREVNLELVFQDNAGGSGIETVRVVEGTNEYTFPVVPGSPTTLPWTLSMGTGTKTVQLILYDRAGNVSDLIEDSIVVDKLQIEKFTLENVINPVVFDYDNPYSPLDWIFPPQPMLAGANITFSTTLKTPYDPDVVYDYVNYQLEITDGEGYSTVLTGEMIRDYGDVYTTTLTLPGDAPLDASINILVTATRELLVSPYDVQVVYFPGDTDATMKAQIGRIDGNINELIKFNLNE